MQSIESALQETALAIEQVLDQILTLEDAAEIQLFDAMRYAALGGGKRFRPFLTCQCAKLFGVDSSNALRAGAAIELIHC